MPPFSETDICNKAAEHLQGILALEHGWSKIDHFGGIKEPTIRLIENSALYRAGNSQCSPLPLPKKYRFDRFIRLVDYLRSPSAFLFPDRWLTFWLMARSEHEFLVEQLRNNTYEPGLNSRFPTQIDMMLRIMSDLNAHFGFTQQRCRFHYLDLQDDEEAHGGDLGFVLLGNFGGKKTVKVIRFQVKRADAPDTTYVTIDDKAISEANKLQEQKGIGYFLFFPRAYGSIPYPAPSVISAQAVLDASQTTNQLSLAHDAWDFAAFMTFGAAAPEVFRGSAGLAVEDEEEAINLLMANNGPDKLAILNVNAAPDRVATLLRTAKKHPVVRARRSAAAHKGWQTRRTKGAQSPTNHKP